MNSISEVPICKNPNSIHVITKDWILIFFAKVRLNFNILPINFKKLDNLPLFRSMIRNMNRQPNWRMNWKISKPYYISSLLLAVPVMISQLGHTLVQTADSIIIGHFAGTVPLAAVSLVHGLFMIIMVIGLGIAMGLTPLIAQENGAKNFANCGKLLTNSLFINVLSGIILFCLIYFGSLSAIEHLDQDPEVVTEAKPYLFLLGISIVPMMIFSAFKQFAEGLGFTRQAMQITIWGNVLNIILAIIFVKGMFGIEPMGVRGVGYSTLIDRCLMAVVMGMYVFRSPKFKAYLGHYKWKTIDTKKIRSILKIGIPIALQAVFEMCAFAGAAVMAGTLGANTQAAHQVAITLASMAYMMATGIASASTIMIGNNFGKKRVLRIKRFAKTNYVLVLVLMILTAGLFWGLDEQLPWIFTKDLDVIAIAAHLLIIAAFFQLFDGTQVVALGILRGLGDVNTPTVLTFLAYWIVGIPVGYWLGIHLGYGIEGIWYGLTLGLLISSILLNWRYRYVIGKIEKQATSW